MFMLGVLLLASVASAQTNIVFGTAATIQPGTSVYAYSTLVIGVGPFFTVTFTNSETVNVSVTITAQTYASGLFAADFTFLNNGLSNIGTSMVQSYLDISILLQSGFIIQTTPANANVALTISFPNPDGGLTATLLAQAYVNAGVLKVNSTAQAYMRVPCVYTKSPYTFSATLPSPIMGTYAIVAINENVTVSTNIVASSVVAPANCNQTFQFAIVGEISTDLQITFQSMSQNQITVTPLNSPPSHAAPSVNGAWMAAYWSVTLSNAQATHNSKVVYTYTASQLSATAALANVTTADATQLAIYWADQGQAWTKATTTVDVSLRTASCWTTHFSDWSVYYQHNGAGAVKAQLSVLVALLLLALSL